LVLGAERIPTAPFFDFGGAFILASLQIELMSLLSHRGEILVQIEFVRDCRTVDLLEIDIETILLVALNVFILGSRLIHYFVSLFQDYKVIYWIIEYNDAENRELPFMTFII